MNVELPIPVAETLGALLSRLALEDFSPIAVEYSPKNFGNFMVTFGNGKHALAIVRDKGQFRVQGERKALELADQWHTFDTIQELEPLLIAWIRSNNQGNLS